MQYPPQPPYQQPSYQYPPQQPPKRTIWQRFRALPMIVQVPIVLFVIIFVGSAAISGVHDAISPPATPTPAPITQPTHVAVKPTQSGIQPTATPQPQPTKAPAAIAATHGTPYLGGPVSDFLGKFGQPINGVSPNSTGWLLDGENTLLLHYDTTTQKVNYIAYTGSSSWSKAKYRDYLLTFAPSDYTEDTAANTTWQNGGGDPYDPIAYTSPVGRFFLHISDGSGWMNTI